jgi:hypothetical protein
VRRSPPGTSAARRSSRAWRCASTTARPTRRTRRSAGATRFAADAILVTEPLIVVEILSPSTATDDRAGRLDGCFRIPSRRHDLILKTSNRTAIHHARDASGRITTRVLQAPDALTLDPPGLVLPVASLFA